MKAFLLAAGLGTRLRPITDTTPKCLVRIGNRTLLDIWLDALAGIGVREVLVNTHHLAPQVRAHLEARPAGQSVRIAHEPSLLGSAGTLVANRDFVDGEDMFLAINADNLTDFDLSTLVEAHRQGDAIATLTLFRTPRPTACGIVSVSAEGRMVGFVEKPAHPPGDLANAGIYAFAPSVLDLVDDPLPRDIGYDLLPRLVDRANAISLGQAYFLDIGTPDALARARDEWPDRRAS